MFIDGSIRDYVKQASDGVPTPGGGSVAALAGALGASMSCMAANFTLGKKKFREVEPQVREQLDCCISARDILLRLVDEDARAYAFVSAAYAMPKDTPTEKFARDAAIQDALVKAMTPPLEIIRTCRKVIDSVAELAGLANPNLISDVGVSAILIDAAVRAAKLNVDINLSGLKDSALVHDTREEISKALDETSMQAAAIAEKVAHAIKDAY